MRKETSSKIFRFLPIVLLVLGLIVVISLGGHRYLTFETLAQNRADVVSFAQNNVLLAVLAYIGAYIVVTSLSLPGGVWLTLTGGFVFGGVWAGLYTVLGATVGATIIFIAARYAFADLCRAKAGSSLAKMEAGFQKNAFNYLMVLRLVPLFPFWLVNLVPALLDVRLSTYVIATFFGIIPGTFVFAFVGAGLGAVFDAGTTPDLSIIFRPAVIGPLLGLAVLSLIPVMYQKFKAKGPES